MSEQEFIESLNEIGITLNSEQLEKFKVYSDFLLDYNKNVNLTAIKSRDEIYLKHFFDSLYILKYKNLNEKSLLDIGSGAGFPSVPLKILCPSLKLTVLDSNGKKTKFLTLLKDKLGLDYEVVNNRAELFCKERRESYDVVVSRAVTQMPILTELSIPFVKVGGEFIPFKGKIDEGLENGKYAIDLLGGEVTDIFNYTLPFEESDRTLIVVYKKCKTECEYPRNFDKINKKPLQK